MIISTLGVGLCFDGENGSVNLVISLTFTFKPVFPKALWFSCILIEWSDGVHVVYLPQAAVDDRSEDRTWQNTGPTNGTF